MSIEPRIEYVTTDDGVSLACTKFGEGPPLIMHYSGMISNFEMELAFPPTLICYEALAKVATVIRYDFRNTGLSTRGVKDISLEAHVRDVEVVRQHFQMEAATLLFPYRTTQLALAYADAHPDRVTALILPYLELDRSSSLIPERVDDLLQAAGRLGWEVLSSVIAVVQMGLEAHANAAWFARYLYESINFEDIMRSEVEFRRHDFVSAAAGVRCPTLLLHRRLPPYAVPASPEMIRAHRANITRFSAAIPGAQSAIFEGSNVWFMDDELMIARIMDFLQGLHPKDAAAPASTTAIPGGFRTVLFTDLVGHTEMMQRLGDARGREVLRDHERITREALKKYAGTEIKTDGDSFMVSFASVAAAVDCAIELQRAFATYSETAGERLVVRMGLNAGEPIEEDGDLFGATVILASRIAAKAGAGEILVSDNVRSLSAGKGFLFGDRGEFVAKGFEEPVRISEVRWRESG
jgi:class 3 adenylate cyclase/pimeloyl-ACP methyl ester carboxylesterase